MAIPQPSLGKSSQPLGICEVRPVISVVTISFNQATYLPAALASIAKQQDVPYEHIIVDPGSTDGSRDLIDMAGAESQEIIRIYEKDEGPADGLNKGFARATGEIFYFLNADDEVSAGAFDFACKFFNENPDIDVLYGGGFIIDERSVKQKFIRPTHFTCLAYLLDATNLLQQSFFFRRKAFEQAGGFNKKNKISWDGELFFRMKAAGLRFHAVYRPLGLFRVYAGSITTSAGQSQRRSEIRQALAIEYMGHSIPTWIKGARPLWLFKKQLSAALIYFRTLIDQKHKTTITDIAIPPVLSIANVWSPAK